MVSLDQWDDYTIAMEQLLPQTDTSDFSRAVIESNCQKRARSNAMRCLLLRLPNTNKDNARIGTVDPLLVGRAAPVAGRAMELMPTSNA